MKVNPDVALHINKENYSSFFHTGKEDCNILSTSLSFNSVHTPHSLEITDAKISPLGKCFKSYYLLGIAGSPTQ